MLNRQLLATLIVGIVLARCGSDDTESTPPTEAAATTTAASVTEPSGEQATETTQSDSDAGTSSGGETSATVVVDGETHQFEFFDLGLCDTDYGGSGVFYAFLQNSNDSSETLTLTLVTNDDLGIESTLALLSPAASWIGNSTEVEGSGVDTFDIDGNHAEGTATIFSDSGEGPVSATFEVTCAG